jgi:hypothetical protein
MAGFCSWSVNECKEAKRWYSCRFFHTPIAFVAKTNLITPLTMIGIFFSLQNSLTNEAITLGPTEEEKRMDSKIRANFLYHHGILSTEYSKNSW